MHRRVTFKVPSGLAAFYSKLHVFASGQQPNSASCGEVIPKIQMVVILSACSLVHQIPNGMIQLGNVAQGRGGKECKAIAQLSPAPPSPGQGLLSPSFHQLAITSPKEVHQGWLCSAPSFLLGVTSSSGIICISHTHTQIHPCPDVASFLLPCLPELLTTMTT